MEPSIRIDDVGRVTLRCNWMISVRRRDPSLDSVHQDDPAAWRMHRDQQQRVVAPGSFTSDCAAGKATSRIRFKPFCCKIHRVTLGAQP